MATFLPSNNKTTPQVVDHTPDHMTLITEEQQLDGGKDGSSKSDDSSDCSSDGENDYDDYEMTEVCDIFI